LLEVVSFAGDVGRDLHTVRQPYARDLAQRGIRLLRRRRVDARADAALLRSTAERGRLRLRLRRDAALPDELIDGRHGLPTFWLLTQQRLAGLADPANRPTMVAKVEGHRKRRKPQ